MPEFDTEAEAVSVAVRKDREDGNVADRAVIRRLDSRGPQGPRGLK